MPLKSHAGAAAEEEEGNVLISQIHPPRSSCHSNSSDFQLKLFDSTGGQHLWSFTLSIAIWQILYRPNIYTGGKGDVEMGLFLSPKYFLFLGLKK